MQFKGAYTALLTPFKGDRVDEQAFADFVDWQITQGIHGLVPCGTTGESPTLSYEEHQRVIEICVEAAAGRVPVMAGTGANATAEAIMFTQHAEKAGAAAALVVAPYYNKPSQEGIYQHFKAIHDASNLPIFVYNIPGRSVINITDETLARLAELPRIAGVKDATGDLSRPLSLRALVGERLQLLSGEDITAVSFNASGGQGVISVASNIAPKAVAEVQDVCLTGDYKKALALQEKLVALHQVMFCETSPGPVKHAASLMGKCSPDLRLPLMPPGEISQKHIEKVLTNLHLI